jgi:hypothetical protein
LLQCGEQFPTLPRAVRNNEIQQTTLFAWFLLLEQPPCIPRKFEQPHAFFKVGPIGGLMPLNLAHATILLRAPLSRHAFEKRAIHLSVELVHIHGVHAGPKPVVFGPQPSDSRVKLALLIGVTGVERVANPGEDLVVKREPAKEVGELPL